jgi:hypothetical protein
MGGTVGSGNIPESDNRQAVSHTNVGSDNDILFEN